MTYMDASSLSEERGDWLRNGRRYRLGQYGIRDDGGTYSTYAVIGGRGYRTGAGLDSFAKSVRHIKGLVEPEDVTEHHYSDAHGVGSAETMAGTAPTGSFAKVREGGRSRELRAYRSAADNPAFQSALASKYGDANRSRSARQADVEALANDGDCEAAAYASLFVNHGGPLPDFMYETEYGRKILDAAAGHHTEPADNPARGVPPGTLMQSTWPMRAILSMMFSAIHTEATGEMRKLGFYDSLQPISRHFQNAFALMEAMDDGGLAKRDAGDYYNIPLYDDDGNEYIYRFNDFMASKYLMQAFPQSRQIPDTLSISTDGLPTSQKMDRKERDMRKRLDRWYNDPSGYPGFAITSGMLNNGRARGSKLNKGNGHESKGGGTSLNAIARQGWTLDTSRPFEFGYVNGYSRNRDAPNGNLKRYISLQSRRKKLEELEKRFSMKGRTAREQKESLSDELDRTLGDIEGKVREIEDYKTKQKSIRAQLEEARQKYDANEWGPDEYNKAKEDAEAQKKNVDDNLTVLYRELRELNSNKRNLSNDLKNHDSIARAVRDGMSEIDRELHGLKNDPDVKKYLAGGESAGLTEWRDSQSMQEMYMETLLDLEKENPMDWNAKGIGMSRDEDGRLIFDTVTDWRGLNNAYGPEIKADPTHILDTMHRMESDTGRRLREAEELRDERRRLRDRSAVEVADEFLKTRGIEDEDTRKLLIDTLAARDMVGKTVSSKGSARSALDPHAQAEETLRVLEARLAQKGVSLKEVDNFSEKEQARVQNALLQTTGTHDTSSYRLKEKQRLEDADDILEYTGMNAEQAGRVDRREATRSEIAMENLGLMMNAIFNAFGGNSDPDAPADTRYRPVVTQERPVRDENGDVVVKELTSEPFDATAGNVANGRIYDAVDARDNRLNPPEEEPRMTEFEAIQATGRGRRGKDRANALSDRLARELGVGQAVPGMVEPSADEPVEEEADGMNDDGANDKHDEGADDMNDRKDERKPDDESDGFTKKAKSANDSRRSMSFREVMGEAASRNESEQGLPTWTDMAGADMRGCDVWKDLWRTVYMESGDGTPTKVRMKVIRDERRCARIQRGPRPPRAQAHSRLLKLHACIQPRGLIHVFLYCNHKSHNGGRGGRPRRHAGRRMRAGRRRGRGDHDVHRHVLR